jgi:hypothetical protein
LRATKASTWPFFVDIKLSHRTLKVQSRKLPMYQYITLTKTKKRPQTLSLIILSLLPPSLAANTNTSTLNPFYHGINMRLASHTGTTYKTPTEWLNSFTRAKSLGFNAVRIYSISDTQFSPSAAPYEPLPSILDAASTTSVDVLLGLYLDAGFDTATRLPLLNSRLRFEREFAALKTGLEYAKERGMLDSVIGVSVGNEDLYEKRQDAGSLAGLIGEVQDWVKGLGACVPVGHTETWDQILDEGNKAVSVFCYILKEICEGREWRGMRE